MTDEANDRDNLLKWLRLYLTDQVGAVTFARLLKHFGNIDNGNMLNPQSMSGELPGLVEAIRAESSAPIVLGGAAVGVAPELLLRKCGADWAVLGNGETVFPALLDHFQTLKKSDPIPGAACMIDGVFKMNPAPIDSLAPDFRVPDYARQLDVRAYRRQLATVPVQTKRGCPFECVYCTYPSIEGSRQRLWAPESVADAIERLARDGLRDIEFVDSLFNCPSEHALAVCEAIAKRGLDARLQTYDLSPLFLDEELVSAMERAGFCGVGITAESASDAALRGLRKGFCADDVRRAASVLRNHNIPTMWIFMFGGPGETESSVAETLDFAASCLGPRDTAFFTVGVRIYPGTRLEKIAREQGRLSIAPEDMLDPVFYVSPDIDAGWLARKVRAAARANPGFVTVDDTGSPAVSVANRFASAIGIRPPLFPHVVRIRRALARVGLGRRPFVKPGIT